MIKRAWYGNESDIGQNLKSEEVLDVTEILQFMVKENSLKLPQSTK